MQVAQYVQFGQAQIAQNILLDYFLEQMFQN